MNRFEDPESVDPRFYQTLYLEQGPRVTDQQRAEERAVYQRGANGLGVLIAHRIRSFNVRERAGKQRPVHYNRLAGNSSL